MRILHYVDENRLAWTESWIQFIKELSRQGVQNCVVCRPGGNLSQRMMEENICCEVFKPLNAFLPFAYSKFDRIFDEFKPDIIHTRLSAAALIGGRFGVRHCVPVVETLDKFAKIKYYSNADILVCCSRAVRDDIVRQGFSNSKTIILHNPLDTALYKKDEEIRSIVRKKLRASADCKIITGVGRFDSGKGFENLIEAYYHLLQDDNCIRDNTLLLLVGDGMLRNKYNRLIEEYKISDKVVMPGFAMDVRPWLWASDIFVFPSNTGEAFGISLMEAMACGLASVATMVGGPEDIIEDGKNGMLVSAGDMAALKVAIRNLLYNEHLRKSLSLAAEERATKFEVRKIASMQIDIYDKLLRYRHVSI
jgi:glycosyltransferase involved in cell wall biosynthesis